MGRGESRILLVSWYKSWLWSISPYSLQVFTLVIIIIYYWWVLCPVLWQRDLLVPWHPLFGICSSMFCTFPYFPYHNFLARLWSTLHGVVTSVKYIYSCYFFKSPPLGAFSFHLHFGCICIYLLPFYFLFRCCFLNMNDLFFPFVY